MRCQLQSKVLIPNQISAAQIISTNISDPSKHAVYDAGKTYTKGQVCRYGDRYMQSNIDDNLNNTPVLKISENGTWGLILNSTGYTFENGAYGNIDEWVPGSYAKGDRKLHLDIDINNHKTYFAFESLADNNTDEPPYLVLEDLKETTTTPWLDRGPANAQAIFDYSKDTKTSNPDLITYVIDPSDKCDSVAILGCDAFLVTVKTTDKITGEPLTEETQTTLQNDEYHWDFFFSDPVPKQDMVFYIGNEDKTKRIEITIDKTGHDASYSTLLIGPTVSIGEPLSLTASGLSYGELLVNRFGRTTLVNAGVNRRKMELSLDSDVDNYNATVKKLDAIQGLPVLAIGMEQIDSSFIYGLSRTYRITPQTAGGANTKYSIEEFR